MNFTELPNVTATALFHHTSSEISGFFSVFSIGAGLVILYFWKPHLFRQRDLDSDDQSVAGLRSDQIDEPTNMAKNNQQVQQQNYPPFNGRLTQNGEIIPTVEITINEGQPTAFNHHLGELSMVQMSIPNAVPFVDSYRNENDDLKQNLL